MLALASTTLVAIAFLVPLFAMVSALAADRAVRPAELAARSLAPTAALVDEATLEEVLAATAADLGGTASVVFPDGAVIGDPVEVDDAIMTARSDVSSLQFAQDDVRRFLVPVIADAGVLVVDVRVVVDRSGVHSAWLALGTLGAALVAGASLLADRMGRTTVDAARALHDTAARLSAGDLEASAGVEDPPDLARVSGALDHLAGRIASLQAEAREQAADLSHGLRTPMTALRLDMEQLPDSAERERLLDDLLGLDRAISQVIDDARSPSRGGGDAPADLVALVAARVAFWRGLAEDEGRSILLATPDEAMPTLLPAGDLTTCMDVLLDNVFRHTPHGTDVDVSMHRDGDHVVLAVADHGVGFPADVDVFERGRSGGDSSGLGLDIVRRAVERAGGHVMATSGAAGGAEVRCLLPRA